MHIPTTALLAISLYIVGRSSAVSSVKAPSHAYGNTDYQIECVQKTYSKEIIYETAKHACETYAAHQDLRQRDFETAGYRSIYDENTKGDDKKKLNPNVYVVPIRTNGVFHFELDTDSRQQRDLLDGTNLSEPGTDRLAIRKNCVILGIFTEKNDQNEAYIKWCLARDKITRKIIPMLGPHRSYAGLRDGPLRNPGSFLGFPLGPFAHHVGYQARSSRSQERPQQRRREPSPSCVSNVALGLLGSLLVYFPWKS